jgi:hypothetical protein
MGHFREGSAECDAWGAQPETGVEASLIVPSTPGARFPIERSCYDTDRQERLPHVDPGASLYIAIENADILSAYCGTCRGMKLVSAYSDVR